MTSPRRAELRRGARAAAKRANAVRAFENPLTVQREYLQALRRVSNDTKCALSRKLPTWMPLVQNTIKNWVRDTGLVEIAEAVLRDHPGKPSKIVSDVLLKAMILGNWKVFSYLRADLLAALAELQDDMLEDYGLVDDDGEALLPNGAAFDKQLRRFEELIRVGKDPVTGAGLDQIEVETRMLTASLPSRIGVEQIALDNTPFESWYLSKVFIKENEAQAETEELYRTLYDPDASEPVPEMGSEMMRDLAEQLGIPIGPDGSIERSHISPEDRIGYRNGVGKRPEGLFLGYAVTFATATAGFYWAGKHDEVKFYPVRPYITCVHTDPANAKLCDNGLAALGQSKRHEPTVSHVLCDQGYSQVDAFLLKALEMGVEPHFNVAKPQISRPPRTVYLANTGDSGTTETVLEHLGAHYHQWMPERLWAPEAGCTRQELAELAAKRLPYRWDDKRPLSDGSVEKKCPFHAGKLYNPRFDIPKRRKSALFVPDEDIPEGAVKCCNGNAVATPQQLAKIQAPPVGTIAHQKLTGYRNPVEGTNGVIKNRHGLQHTTCRAPGLVPHALAAAITAVVRNLQLTLDDELKRRRNHLRQKTERKSRSKTRREQQIPQDGRPAPTEQASPEPPGASDQEPDSATSADSDTLTPPRAPP